MGLGKAGAIHAAKSGGILSIVLLSSYRVADYFLTDNATLSQLIGSLATDVVKIGIATGASIAAATIAGAAFTVAIGPIVAVVAVGFVTSVLLSMVDERYGITDRVIAGLDEVGDDVDSYIKGVKSDLQQKVAGTANEVIDYAIDSARRIVINTAMHALHKYLAPVPKVYK